MFSPIRGRRASPPPTEVNLAPLIDMVFILLIFFLVTSTFVRETGVKVDKPQATASVSLESQSLRVAIAAGGGVYVEGRRLDLAQLRAAVREFIARERVASVVIIPDTSLPSGRLVEVIDAAKLGGAREIALATRDKQ